MDDLKYDTKCPQKSYTPSDNQNVGSIIWVTKMFSNCWKLSQIQVNSSWIIKCLLTSWLSGKQQSCCHTKRLPSKVRFLTETQKFNTNKHITVWLKHLQMFLSHSYGLNLIQLAGLEGFKTTSQLSPCTGFKGLLNNAHVEEVTSQKINNHKKSIEHLK